MRRVVSVSLIVLLMAVLLPVQSADAAGWGILGTHYVRPGETLYCIGRAYGVSPWAIATQNGILNANLIRVGMALAIPNAPATLTPGPVCARQFPSYSPYYPPACGGCVCRYHHLITTGDTLTRISVRYGVDMWSIAACNCIYNLNYIRIGYWLCIP